MKSRSAATGAILAEVETPALLIDAAAMERNLQRMARFAHESGIALRAHAKSHKCPTIGLRQVSLGAVGLCCQTLREAEAMVAAGIDDIFLSNEIVSAGKIDRLARLAKNARIAVCVDDARNVADLSAAATRHATTLNVLIEVNVGDNRCGVAPGQPALDLARAIIASPGLGFTGLHAYYGRAQHFREHDERQNAIHHAIELARQTRDLLRSSGIQCQVITGAGTGTFHIETASGVYNEIQAGSYVFMDADYSRNKTADDTPFAEFEQSLFVLATVISRGAPDRAVVDAGLKAIGVDAGLPVVAEPAGARYVRASDEHGVIDLSACATQVRVGDRIRLIPGNCDPTVNLHDSFVVVRDGRVEATWPIVARGPAN